jgi:prepilin-type N-terminal cleavage/methylation domain-containing protein
MNAMNKITDKLHGTRRDSLASAAGSDGTHLRARAGFTLIELMVVMAIMTVLSAMIAVAVSGAQESARVAHTRAVIARIHTLLMDRVESYRSRRLPIQIQLGSTPAQAAQLRCNAIRELMRMELPDRWTDITDPPVTKFGSLTMAPTATFVSYQAALSNAGITTSSDPTYQGADCLYLIVTMGLEENDVLENFAQGDIGTDPKNPKMLCFIDSWGNPIQFLRWAPGFNSPLQPANPTDRDQTDPTGQFGSPYPTGSPTGTIGSTPPPLTFALYPLIYSAGPDGYYDITVDTSPTLHYSQTNPPNNPFTGVGTPNALGTPAISPSNTTGSIGTADNIHNQELGVH